MTDTLCISTARPGDDVLGGNVPAERLYTGQGFTYRGPQPVFACWCAQYALMGSESSSCPFSTERMTMS